MMIIFSFFFGGGYLLVIQQSSWTWLDASGKECPWHTIHHHLGRLCHQIYQFSGPQKGTTYIHIYIYTYLRFLWFLCDKKSEIPQVFDQTNGWLGQSTRRPRCSNAPWIMNGQHFPLKRQSLPRWTVSWPMGVPKFGYPGSPLLSQFRITKWGFPQGTSYEDGWFGGSPILGHPQITLRITWGPLLVKN